MFGQSKTDRNSNNFFLIRIEFRILSRNKVNKSSYYQYQNSYQAMSFIDVDSILVGDCDCPITLSFFGFLPLFFFSRNLYSYERA